MKIGGGLGQKEIGMVGLVVSGYFELIIGTLPIVKGNKQSQQRPLMGLTNSPVQAAVSASVGGL
ncbi:hypothetical protein TUM4438_39540 [Shewanella sairae]|uniref:Uncharacterized protein n=1 Tax=Shewanella sairae TaxID=190310 RepID=A0ABQ4PQ35_9GAMM|nr:hypothetical protein TUM4438_39540 [Shewanella sairae]